MSAPVSVSDIDSANELKFDYGVPVLMRDASNPPMDGQGGNAISCVPLYVCWSRFAPSRTLAVRAYLPLSLPLSSREWVFKHSSSTSLSRGRADALHATPFFSSIITTGRHTTPNHRYPAMAHCLGFHSLMPRSWRECHAIRRDATNGELLTRGHGVIHPPPPSTRNLHWRRLPPSGVRLGR